MFLSLQLSVGGSVTCDLNVEMLRGVTDGLFVQPLQQASYLDNAAGYRKTGEIDICA